MKRKKQFALSDQLRAIIEQSEMSRYRIAKDSNVDAGQLCRFMQGKAQLTFETLDRIGDVLGLRLSAEPNQPESTSVVIKPRTKSAKRKTTR